jgi:hypothetical protein
MSVVASDVHAERVESLDGRVRQAVRLEGVDPQREAVVVSRLAEAVVRARDERNLTGMVVGQRRRLDGRRTGGPGLDDPRRVIERPALVAAPELLPMK